MGKYVKVNLQFPEISTDKWLEHVADRVIIPDINKGIQNSTDLNQKPYPPLAPATKKIRNKKGYGFTPLKATGQLRASIRSKAVNKGRLIYFKGNRKEGKESNEDVADILQNQGVRSKALGLRTFEFFGISDIAEVKSLKYIVSQINKAIKDGKRRTVQ